MGFLSNIFSRKRSGTVAKDRLQVVLMHDRADISPDLMNSLRNDIIEVIRNYVEIDEGNIELEFEREDRSVALVANIPVKMVRRSRRSKS